VLSVCIGVVRGVGIAEGGIDKNALYRHCGHSYE